MERGNIGYRPNIRNEIIDALYVEQHCGPIHAASVYKIDAMIDATLERFWHEMAGEEKIMAAPQLHPPTQNSIFVIAPYWAHGTWVFDDPARGLVGEPFVAGVPDVLNDLVAAIPQARLGFRLIFSARRFPGAQASFVRGRSETGGTWYLADDGREGWLCPALFKYFTVAPAELHVRAEPIH